MGGDLPAPAGLQRALGALLGTLDNGGRWGRPWHPLPYCARLTACTGRFSVAKFIGKIKGPNGETFDIPAETCPHCKGIGYLTGPLEYRSRRRGEDTFHIHRAESGDRCPTCVGKGWL